jgi:hypothetical protein
VPRPKETEASLPTLSRRTHWPEPTPCAVFGGALPQILWIKALDPRPIESAAMHEKQ